MSSRTCFAATLALVALGAFGSGNSARVAQEPRPQEPSDDATWQELATEYEAALEDWNARVRASTGASERAAVRRENPTPRYAPAFELLADSGEIHALFWLLDHLPDLGGRSAERKARRLALYEQMIREHGGTDLLLEGMARMHEDSRLRREQGFGTIGRLTNDAMKTHASEMVHDSLRLGLATCASKSREPQSTAQALALLDEILASKRLAADELDRASELSFELLHLRMGCEAPDFEGRTVDGDSFRLSDYRGKVVVLDFFGFW